MRRRLSSLLLAAFVAVLIHSQSVAAKPRIDSPPAAAITLSVDATEAPRKLFHARMTMPVSPGPLTLVYPKWIPGEHGPTGPIVNLAGLKLTAGGKTIPWRRDEVDMYAFHLEVPAGARELEVALDFLSPTFAGGFTAGASTTSHLAIVTWNQLLLYPQGSNISDVTFKASLSLPAGWKFGTSLPVASQSASKVNFASVSLDRLVVEKNFNPEVGFLRRENFRRSFAQGRFSPAPHPRRQRLELEFRRRFSKVHNSHCQ